MTFALDEEKISDGTEANPSVISVISVGFEISQWRFSET